MHLVFVLIPAINSGWGVTLSRDGIYCLCKNKFGMIIMCLVGMYGQSVPLCSPVVLKETISGYSNTWKGLVVAAFYLLKSTKLCMSTDWQFWKDIQACMGRKGFQDFTKTNMNKYTTNFSIDKELSENILVGTTSPRSHCLLEEVFQILCLQNS